MGKYNPELSDSLLTKTNFSADNLYTSYPLIMALKEHGVNYLGTVRQNRKGAKNIWDLRYRGCPKKMSLYGILEHGALYSTTGTTGLVQYSSI